MRSIWHLCMIHPFVMLNTPTYITSPVTAPAVKALIICFLLPRILFCRQKTLNTEGHVWNRDASRDWRTRRTDVNSYKEGAIYQASPPAPLYLLNLFLFQMQLLFGQAKLILPQLFGHDICLFYFGEQGPSSPAQFHSPAFCAFKLVHLEGGKALPHLAN